MKRARGCSLAPGGRLAASVAIVGAWLLLLAVGAAPALAGGWWRVSSRAAPSDLPPEGKATLNVSASNVGDGAINAAARPVRVSDTLPAGLEATAIEGAPAFEESEEGHAMSCDLATLSCTAAPEVLAPFQALEITIQVNVKPGASSGEENTVSVSGGAQEGGEEASEPPAASVSRPLTVSEQPTPFGLEQDGYNLTPEAEGGTLDTAAGSHPFQLTTTLDLNQTLEPVRERRPVAAAPALPKELAFNLPPGLIGDPLAVKPCPGADFQAITHADTNACDPESAIGVAVVTINEPAQFHTITRAVPLWNLEPAKGEPARLGFEILKVPVVLDTSVRTSGDYGVTVSIDDAPQAAQLLASEVTIWGAPGDARHAQSRGWSCLNGGEWVEHRLPCETRSESPPKAFLTLPTSCTGHTTSTVEGHSWPVQSLASEPGQIFSVEGPQVEAELPALEGCEDLPFSPSIGVETESHAASTPTGLQADVHVPQQATLEADGLAQADVQSTTVTLPAGVQLNPSAANGLQACSEEQVGYQGPGGVDPLARGAPEPLRFSSEPARCPDASKIGTVHVDTPLLEHQMSGAVYLASQDANPFRSLLALYVVTEDPFSGIRVKLAGEVKLNGTTGQVTSTFPDTPQVPFENFRLEFPGGPRAALSTPALCENYQTQASFTPWSGGEPFAALAGASEFTINSGPGGLPCADPRLLAPSLQAGSRSLQAGGFSSFALQMTNHDQNQALTGVALRLPPGVAALLSSLVPCGEPQASLGTCGPESQIGQANASVGYGPDPYSIGGGRVYLTGPYAGAPFGLSIVTPAVAGPFDLGLVVVRSQIFVDPHTAQVTISSPLPTIVQGVGMAPSGIPLDLKQVNVDVDRPGFQFNPTSCNPMRIESMLSGSEGATAPSSIPFQVANCSGLPFKPKLTASTKGQASKANGANFNVKVQSNGLGQANIAKVRLQLPKALPARLTTLQKACTESAFNSNPASCPEGSVIGTATIHTPVLGSPLSGPAYLVSHGGAAFPDVEFVLQGEGITLVLDGKTQVKNQITYSKFESAPDAPFTVFDTVLPAGPHSALTANLPEKAHFNLCNSSLWMPTEIVGQNGAVIKQNTKIAEQGCRGVEAVRKSQLSRSQLLKRALAACRKRHRHSKPRRVVCEKQARRLYAAMKTSPRRAHRSARSRTRTRAS